MLFEHNENYVPSSLVISDNVKFLPFRAKETLLYYVRNRYLYYHKFLLKLKGESKFRHDEYLFQQIMRLWLGVEVFFFFSFSTYLGV